MSKCHRKSMKSFLSTWHDHLNGILQPKFILYFLFFILHSDPFPNLRVITQITGLFYLSAKGKKHSSFKFNQCETIQSVLNERTDYLDDANWNLAIQFLGFTYTMLLWILLIIAQNAAWFTRHNKMCINLSQPQITLKAKPASVAAVFDQQAIINCNYKLGLEGSIWKEIFKHVGNTKVLLISVWLISSLSLLDRCLVMFSLTSFVQRL